MCLNRARAREFRVTFFAITRDGKIPFKVQRTQYCRKIPFQVRTACRKHFLLATSNHDLLTQLTADVDGACYHKKDLGKRCSCSLAQSHLRQSQRDSSRFPTTIHRIASSCPPHCDGELPGHASSPSSATIRIAMPLLHRRVTNASLCLAKYLRYVWTAASNDSIGGSHDS